MARQFNGKRPENLKQTIRAFAGYLGRHKALLGIVGVLAAVSALANLIGAYMIKPVVNGLIDNGTVEKLLSGVALTAAIYGAGALSALGYTQLMARAAQKILYDIRRDLFSHLQKLPLRYFDTQRKGNLMSLFTNDVDTISDALNNSFAMIIQSFIQVVGTLTLLFLLNWRLSLLVVVGYAAMFLYIRYSTRRSQEYYQRHQAYLGELDGYVEEMVAGQKVVKVFNHEKQNLEGFLHRKRRPAQGRHARAGVCGDDGAGGCEHFLFELRGHRGGRRHHGVERPDGFGQPCELSRACAAVGAAD